MKQLRKIIFQIIFLIVAVSSVNAQNWQIVWQDEFDGSIGPDWVFETGGGGWGNNELEYYRRENASVQNGQLVISAKKESFGGYNYTSVRMKTQGKKSWKYGKIEARIAMPAFAGAWPAFWMLGDNIGSVGWPKCGEIDIMEHINAEQVEYGTIHWADAGGNHVQYSNNVGVNNVAGFHTYAIEWDANSIKWFVDGVQFAAANIQNNINSTEEFQNNFFILLNFAIGGNWPGFNVDNNAFTANMYVDYVRVYQQGVAPPPPPPTTGLVTAYKDCNYSGFSAGLNVGDYTLSQLQALGVLDNDISSLKITQGYKAILYDGDNFSGNSTTITSDMGCSADWNDKTTSVRIRTNGDQSLSGIYVLQNRNSGLIMDVTGGIGATGDGAKIQQWNSTENTNQQFQFDHLGDGTYKITAIHSGKVLDIDGIKMDNGARAQQWTYFGTANQQFIAVPTGDGYFKLVAKHSGRIVEVAGASTAPEGIVQQWDNNNQTCGMWKLNRPAPVNGNGDGLTGSYFNGMNFETPVVSMKDANLSMNWGNGSPNASVNSDQFSARWTGQIQPRYSGTYTFYINSDNGRRVWVNNQLIIDKWIDDWNIDYTGTITLERGVKYDITVEYFENAGGAGVKLDWSSPIQGRETVPTSQLYSNPVPTVSITSPANNASFTSPASFAVNANASDNVSVSKVDFYNGTTLIGSDNAAPYSVNVSSLAPGNYTLKAIAFDNKGAFNVTSNVAVSVISDPLSGNGDGLSGNYFNGMNFETLKYSGKDATLNLNWGNGSPNAAVNADQFSARWTGQIQPKYSGEYTFYINSDNGRRVWIDGQLIIDKWIDDWNIDYTGKITLTGKQKYDIKVEYFENNGGASIKLEWSSAVQAREVVPMSQLYSNPLPTVSVSSSATTIVGPANLTLTAGASDADGISKVDFYNGTTLLSSTTTSPYKFAWNNVAIGTYSITALATDSKGGVSLSSAVTVKVTSAVNNAPTVSITAPANNSSYNAPASISFTANASDSDGSISKVEYFNGSTSIGSATASPYNVTWSNVAAGTYTITAKATDNGGAVTTSSAITVVVKQVVTNACSGVTQYTENGGYVAGSIVQNAGSKYSCKPYPYTGWCNGAAWAYAPGTGSYWTDAWDLVGPCTSARMAQVDAATESFIAPNPTLGLINIQSSQTTTVSVYNSIGAEMILPTVVEPKGTLDLSALPAGMYLVKIDTGTEVLTQKILKQ